MRACLLPSLKAVQCKCRIRLPVALSNTINVACPSVSRVSRELHGRSKEKAINNGWSHARLCHSISMKRPVYNNNHRFSAQRDQKRASLNIFYQVDFDSALRSSHILKQSEAETQQSGNSEDGGSNPGESDQELSTSPDYCGHVIFLCH